MNTIFAIRHVAFDEFQGVAISLPRQVGDIARAVGPIAVEAELVHDDRMAAAREEQRDIGGVDHRSIHAFPRTIILLRADHFGRPLAHYATVDLRAGLDFGRWTLSAFARNLTDKRAIIVDGYEGLAPSQVAGTPYAASVITPRTIGAEAAIRF